MTSKTNKHYEIELNDLRNIKDMLKKKFPNTTLYGRTKLPLYHEYVDLLFSGNKKTTIRFRKNGIDFPGFKILPLISTSNFSKKYLTNQIGNVLITNYIVKKFIKLSTNDAQLDGFVNLNKLKETLFKIYGKIEDDDLISIYTIKYIESENDSIFNQEIIKNNHERSA